VLWTVLGSLRQQPPPTRTALLLEDLELGRAGFGGIHRQLVGIPVFPATPSPTGELITGDRDGGQRDGCSARIALTTGRTTRNPARIAGDGTAGGVEIDDC